MVCFRWTGSGEGSAQVAAALREEGFVRVGSPANERSMSPRSHCLHLPPQRATGNGNGKPPQLYVVVDRWRPVHEENRLRDSAGSRLRQRQGRCYVFMAKRRRRRRPENVGNPASIVTLAPGGRSLGVRIAVREYPEPEPRLFGFKPLGPYEGEGLRRVDPNGPGGSDRISSARSCALVPAYNTVRVKLLALAGDHGFRSTSLFPARATALEITPVPD